MTRLSPEQVWQELAHAGLVAGEAPEPSRSATPWVVRLMLGVAGWFGALFVLVFLFLFFKHLWSSAQLLMAFGLALCSIAAVCYRSRHRNDFIEQLGLALSLAGQYLVISGLLNWLGSRSNLSFVVVALFEAALVAVMADALHRTLSAFAAAIALSYALFLQGAMNLPATALAAGLVLVWTQEFAWSQRGALLRPVGYGLALAAVYIDHALLRGEFWFLSRPIRHGQAFNVAEATTATLLLCVISLVAALRILQREGIPPGSTWSRVALFASLAVSATSYRAPGLAVGLLILLLGFANGNRLLAGLGVLALAAYLSHYYYQLQWTLLDKSLVLFATGALLLALRYGLSKFWGGEKRHA